MTTTELIKILQDNEKGGISHKPRNISLYINGRLMVNPQISLSSTGDGICGPEIDLDIDGDWFEREEERMKIEKPCNLEVPTGATPMTKICKFNKMPYEALYNTKEVAMHLLAYCTNRARWEGEADDE